MARRNSNIPISGSFGPICLYSMYGRNYARAASSLTRERVLKDAAFKETRRHASLLARASKIGAAVYNALPAYWRQGWMYRAFTGEALTRLKEGKTDQEVMQTLHSIYVVAGI